MIEDHSLCIRFSDKDKNKTYLKVRVLGTATFITNSQGEATQFFLNLSFGETMLEQMDGSYNNSYKLNC